MTDTQRDLVILPVLLNREHARRWSANNSGGGFTTVSRDIASQMLTMLDDTGPGSADIGDAMRVHRMLLDLVRSIPTTSLVTRIVEYAARDRIDAGGPPNGRRAVIAELRDELDKLDQYVAAFDEPATAHEPAEHTERPAMEVRGVRLLDLYRDHNGDVWEVIGITTEPTATIRNVLTREQIVEVIGCGNWQQRWQRGPMR